VNIAAVRYIIYLNLVYIIMGDIEVSLRSISNIHTYFAWLGLTQLSTADDNVANGIPCARRILPSRILEPVSSGSETAIDSAATSLADIVGAGGSGE
jgi:hypothetical protein